MFYREETELPFWGSLHFWTIFFARPDMAFHQVVFFAPAVFVGPLTVNREPPMNYGSIWASPKA